MSPEDLEKLNQQFAQRNGMGRISLGKLPLLAKREKGKTPSEIVGMLEIDITIVEGLLNGQ